MTAEDQKAVQAATQRIVWAVIGIVVIMLAYAFVDMIVGLSNIPPGG